MSYIPDIKACTSKQAKRSTYTSFDPIQSLVMLFCLPPHPPSHPPTNQNMPFLIPHQRTHYSPFVDILKPQFFFNMTSHPLRCEHICFWSSLASNTNYPSIFRCPLYLSLVYNRYKFSQCDCLILTDTEIAGINACLKASMIGL